MHNICRYKIIFFLALFLKNYYGYSQKGIINLPNYDSRYLHYGFTIGIHGSQYSYRYSDNITNPLDTIHSIIPEILPGFKTGFIANFRVVQYLDFRVHIIVGIYENKLTYRNIYGGKYEALLEDVYIEIPLFLKYKSVRRKNSRMYIIGGITSMIAARGKQTKDPTTDRLQTKDFFLATEVGVGIDIYYPFFKFSPELRYSFGLNNILEGEENKFNRNLKQLTPHIITLYISFEGSL
ncbi:MAG: porin family protein [Chitinophagaceae bacterium]|nr:porin family protein [Chitinophagaceae bacterium]